MTTVYASSRTRGQPYTGQARSGIQQKLGYSLGLDFGRHRDDGNSE